MRKLIKLICLSLLFQQCQQASEEFRVLDLDANHPSKELKLSEIASDFRMVQFETTDSSLLPSYFNYLVGSKYIFTFSRQNILQFRSDGKFIRVLAKAGKGPGEFNYISSTLVDKPEEKLYVAHQGASEILVFDLLNGLLEEGISIPEKANNLTFINDEELLVYCYGYNDFESFHVNVKTGEISKTVIFEDENKARFRGMKSSVISNYNEDVYALLGIVDTLYSYTDDKLIPELLFRFNNKVNYTKTNLGRDIFLRIYSKKDLLFYTQDVSIKREEGYAETRFGGNDAIFLYQKQEKKLYKITQFENDFLQVPVEYASRIRQFDDVLSIKYTAMDIIGHLEEYPELRGHYDELFDGYLVKEDDNPMLLIGKVL